jgi:hypothetical protein
MPVTREMRKKFGEAIKPVKDGDEFKMELVDLSTGDVLLSATSSKSVVGKLMNDYIDRLDDNTFLNIHRVKEEK